jgi:roadblock/LC7 domain-containing protein
MQTQTELIQSLCSKKDVQDQNQNDNGSEEVEFVDEEPFDTEREARNLLGGDSDNIENEHEDEVDADLQAILLQSNEIEEYGPSIVASVAASFTNMMEKANKETFQKLKEQYKLPENCKAVGVPKVNPEIWGSLPAFVKAADARLQNQQQHLSKSIVAQVNIVQEVITHSKSIPKEISEKIVKSSMDSVALLSSMMKDINMKRKFGIKPSLQSEYSGICSSRVPTTEYLFGDNLADNLKNIKSSSKIVKSSTATPTYSRGGSRFMPYTRGRPQTSRPLNYQAPFLPRLGGSGFPQRFRAITPFQKESRSSHQFKPRNQ